MSYTREFFSGQREGSRRSAALVLPGVLDRVRPATAIDVGCGVGPWTRVLLDAGVDAVGVDGDYVDRAQLEIPAERFLAADLESPRWGIDRSFDLAISLEVAEHLSPAAGPGFVASLTRLAPVVLFSAAVPWQGGEAHLNERWQSFWAAEFARHGFAPYDVVRPALWSDGRVEPWYRQNTLLYARADAAARLGLGEAVCPQLLDVVHPQLFLLKQHFPPRGAIWRRVGALLRRTTTSG